MLFGMFLTVDTNNIYKDSILRKWWNVKCCKMSKIIRFIVYFQPGVTKPPSPVFYRGWVWRYNFHGRRGYNEKLTKNVCWNIWGHVANTYCSSIIDEQDWPRASTVKWFVSSNSDVISKRHEHPDSSRARMAVRQTGRDGCTSVFHYVLSWTSGCMTPLWIIPSHIGALSVLSFVIISMYIVVYIFKMSRLKLSGHGFKILV